MSNANIKKILEGALKLIEEKGWCQGSYAKINGKTCQANNKYATEFDLLGALHRAAGAKTLWSERIWDYFDEAVGKNPGRWNDHAKRSKDDVVSALKNAIRKVNDESN